MKRQLSKGQEVMIFQNPLSEANPEGSAILVSKIHEDPPSVMPKTETWLVKFIRSGEKAARAILVEN